ncbi:MAG: alanine racemase [Limnochordia bacterium]|jgi:D-serine deaminase-like pyridoxal phosphate-dependent protein
MDYRRAVETPALIIDEDVMERNLAKMMELAREAGVKLRPHAKTHKSVALARRQLQGGCQGITVSKVSEGEVMARGGIDDILVAYPIVGEEKIGRLLELNRRVRLATLVDSLEAARALGAAAEGAGQILGIYLKIDTGMGRTGVPPGRAALELARKLQKLPGLNLMGILSHPGEAYNARTRDDMALIARREGETMAATAQLLRQGGVKLQEVSVGSTPTCWTGVIPSGVTEIRPGTYIFNDANNVHWGTCTIADCAATVLTTVVSRPHPRRLIVDGGSKSVGKETNPAYEGYGLIKGMPNARLVRVYEEHGVIETQGGCPLPIGAKLEIIPTHICPVVNLYSEYILVSRGRIIAREPIDARGCNY